MISSPLVDLASILLIASIFNWKIAIAYVVVRLLLAVTGGTVISKLKVFCVTNMVEIAASDLMRTPELIINGKVKSAGRVPGVQEIRKMIEDEK